MGTGEPPFTPPAAHPRAFHPRFWLGARPEGLVRLGPEGGHVREWTLLACNGGPPLRDLVVEIPGAAEPAALGTLGEMQLRLAYRAAPGMPLPAGVYRWRGRGAAGVEVTGEAHLQELNRPARFPYCLERASYLPLAPPAPWSVAEVAALLALPDGAELHAESALRSCLQWARSLAARLEEAPGRAHAATLARSAAADVFGLSVAELDDPLLDQGLAALAQRLR